MNLIEHARAYHEYDEIPAHINPLFYDALDDWGFDGSICDFFAQPALR